MYVRMPCFTFMILTTAASMACDLSSSTLFVLLVSSREAIAIRTYTHTYIHHTSYDVYVRTHKRRTTLIGLVNWSLKAKLSEFLIALS